MASSRTGPGSGAKGSVRGGIQGAKEEGAEVNEIGGTFGGLEADRQSGEGSSDAEATGAQEDLALAFYLAHQPAGGVAGSTKAWHLAFAGSIARGGRTLPVGFVRAVMVVTMSPFPQPAQERCMGTRTALHQVVLQCPVQLFMCVVVDPAGTVHELDPDAQPAPPKAQCGQPMRTGAAERRASVGTDRLGKPIAMEEPNKDRRTAASLVAGTAVIANR